MHQEVKLDRQQELTGGGLIRSAGVWSEVLSMKRRGERQFSDERILGSGDFAQEVIAEADASVREKVPLAKRSSEVIEMMECCCQRHGVSRQAQESGFRRKEFPEIRKELAMTLVFEMGYGSTAWSIGIGSEPDYHIATVSGSA